MARKIVVLLLTAFAAATAFSAVAAPILFQMVGGICTSGCSGSITVTVEMEDGYVPGTPFSAPACCATSPVVHFLYSDGVQLIDAIFITGAFGTGNSGVLSDVPGESEVHIHWYDGFFFDAFADGTWFFGLESGGGAYVTSGRYTDFVIVPEPATFALLGLGLAGLAATRRRKLN